MYTGPTDCDFQNSQKMLVNFKNAKTRTQMLRQDMDINTILNTVADSSNSGKVTRRLTAHWDPLCPVRYCSIAASLHHCITASNIGFRLSIPPMDHALIT